MSGPDDLKNYFIEQVYGMKDDTPLEQQVARLKIQVEMLQGIVNGLQAEKKTIATTVKQVMKDDKLIADYISGELKRISEEAVATAREALLKKADKI